MRRQLAREVAKAASAQSTQAPHRRCRYLTTLLRLAPARRTESTVTRHATQSLGWKSSLSNAIHHRRMVSRVRWTSAFTCRCPVPPSVCAGSRAASPPPPSFPPLGRARMFPLSGWLLRAVAGVVIGVTDGHWRLVEGWTRSQPRPMISRGRAPLFRARILPKDRRKGRRGFLPHSQKTNCRGIHHVEDFPYCKKSHRPFKRPSGKCWGSNSKAWSRPKIRLALRDLPVASSAASVAHMPARCRWLWQGKGRMPSNARCSSSVGGAPPAIFTRRREV